MTSRTMTLLAGLLAISAAVPATAQTAARSATFSRYSATMAAARASANLLGNLHEVGQGNLHYRWTRGDLDVDLRDRNGRWSEPEAIWVRDALDNLPDLYIRKAIAGGMQQIYRDAALPTA